MASTQPSMTEVGQPVCTITSKRDGNPTTVIDLFGNRQQQPRVQENPAAALEAMPHLMDKICGIWGKRECESFINGLLMDSRDGARQGLPWEAAQDLLFLAELHAERRALAAAEMTGGPLNQTARPAGQAAQRTKQAPTIGGLSLEPMTDPWSDPRKSADTSRERRPQSANANPMDAARERRPQTRKSTSTPEKTGWLGKLLG